MRLVRKTQGCDIILVVYNEPDYTKACIASILRSTRVPFRIFVVDNASKKETREYLAEIQREYPDRIAIIQNEKNEGWVRAVNKGIQASRSPYLCVMNNDTVVTPGWLEEMIRIAGLEEKIGLVNPSWEDKPERVGDIGKHAASLKRWAGQAVEMDWCRGFCFLIKREVLEAVHGLDLAYDPAYYDDWDFSVRAVRSGFRCMLAKGAYVHHWQNVTYPEVLGRVSWNELFERNRRIFYERWGVPLRVVLVLGKDMQERIPVFRNLFFELLRDQHKLYVWHSINPLSLPPHINLNLSYTPFGIPWVAQFKLWNNVRRSPEKKYDLVLVFDPRIHRLLNGYGDKIPLCLLVEKEAAPLVEAVREKVKEIKALKQDQVLARLSQERPCPPGHSDR